MQQNKKIIGIVIFVLTIIVLLTISIIKIISRQMDFSGRQNEGENYQRESILSNEETNVAMSELSKIMANKTNACKLIVNGEKISEKEIAYINFQTNSTVINNIDSIVISRKEATPEKQIIREYVIVQDAKKKNITLTESEAKVIEERIKNNFQEGNDEMKEVLNAFHMSYDEFIEFYIDRAKRLEIQNKWSLSVSKLIENGELITEDKIFNNQYKKYRESKDNTQRFQLLLELINNYKEYLINIAIVEHID